MKFFKPFLAKLEGRREAHKTRATKADRAPRTRKQKILNLVGWVMIAGGATSMGFFVYENFVGNWIQAPIQEANAKRLTEQFEKSASEPTASATAKQRLTRGYPLLKGNYKEATEFATIRIPALGKDWVHTIGEGTRQATVLNTVGVGHYPSTQMPGEVGNFAVAAHRTSHGAPFRDIDQLKAGDEILISTAKGRYVYEVVEQQVVDPTDVWVISPNRGSKGGPKKAKWMTMTTCTPKYSNAQRLIVWSKFKYFEEK